MSLAATLRPAAGRERIPRKVPRSHPRRTEIPRAGGLAAIRAELIELELDARAMGLPVLPVRPTLALVLGRRRARPRDERQLELRLEPGRRTVVRHPGLSMLLASSYLRRPHPVLVDSKLYTASCL